VARVGDETGWAEVNGTRLYYESHAGPAGDGAPPALLFLHGFTLDRRMWDPQVEALAGRFRIVRYDARGFGRSAMPDPATPYRHCDDAAALCEHLDLPRVVAVGHSIGGHQTLELALERPDLVAAWGSICTAGLAGVPLPADIARMFPALRALAQAAGVAAARDVWSHCGWFAPLRERPELAAAFQRIIDDYSGWHWLHRNPARDAEPPAAERLGALAVPALIVTGGRDLDHNTEVARRLLAGIPGARRLHLPDAGHMANMEAPEAVNVALAELCGAG
jgi:pimeloyl-ACP methyl ester carboxylesterase